MTQSTAELPISSSTGGATVVRAVTVIMGVVVGLTFLFGFGNVLDLALCLGVPVWVAPLVAPAVDLSILGLLLGIRHLALAGAVPAQLRPARRLLIFASGVTLALNVADPLIAGEYGKAAFDAVGPLLLIGWAEVGPDLLRALTVVGRPDEVPLDEVSRLDAPFADEPTAVGQTARGLCMEGTKAGGAPSSGQNSRIPSDMVDADLLARARAADARHWLAHRRPISADTLRRNLRIGAARSRLLITMIRADPQSGPPVQDGTHGTRSNRRAGPETV